MNVLIPVWLHSAVLMQCVPLMDIIKLDAIVLMDIRVILTKYAKDLSALATMIALHLWPAAT